MGEYDVTVTIETFVSEREIAWTILGTVRPPIGHVYGYRIEPTDDGCLVTSHCDWSEIAPAWRETGIFREYLVAGHDQRECSRPVVRCA